MAAQHPRAGSRATAAAACPVTCRSRRHTPTSSSSNSSSSSSCSISCSCSSSSSSSSIMDRGCSRRPAGFKARGLVASWAYRGASRAGMGAPPACLPPQPACCSAPRCLAATPPATAPLAARCLPRCEYPDRMICLPHPLTSCTAPGFEVAWGHWLQHHAVAVQCV
jgi:hypothetical protein